MSKQLFLILLIILVLSVFGACFFYIRGVGDNMPNNTCVSTITNGQFIGDDLKSYVFNGTVTFRIKQSKISIFAVIQEEEDKSILRRDLLLDKIVRNSTGIINTKVHQRYIYSTDTASDKRVLFSDRNEDINLVFRRLRRGVYMVYVNDNWIMTCQEMK